MIEAFFTQESKPILQLPGSIETLEDVATGPVPITIVGDQLVPSAVVITPFLEPPGEQLIVSSNIQFQGSNEFRTMDIIPSTNQYGVAYLNLISSIASTQQKIGTNRVQVSITPVLDPPVLEVLDIELVQVGERVLISPIVSIIDGSNSDLLFELATAPQNAVINPRTGQLVWVPGVEHVGLQLFQIDAKRGGGSASTGSVTFDLRVVAPESLSLSADETSGVSLRWQSGTNSLFRIQAKDDLNDPVWIDLGEQSGVEGSFKFMELDIDRPQRFYRLRRIR